MSPRPVIDLQGAQKRRKEAPAGAASGDSRPGLRILVVDDNADAATSLGRLLSLLGHEVRVVHNGPAALTQMEPFGPHVVLLDLGMPGMDGLETADRIRLGPAAGLPALVAITGWGQEQDRQLTEAAGFSAHLTKPVNLDQLEAVLSQIAARSPAHSRL